MARALLRPQKVLDIFKRHNFSDASVIGQISTKLDKPLVISR